MWSIARADLGLSDSEFLQIVPAALELLMRRLQVWDRKALHGAAMICAEVWNSAGMHIDREKHPDPFSAQDFLPEEAARREAEEEAERSRPINPEQFAQFKAGLVALTKKKQ